MTIHFPERPRPKPTDTRPGAKAPARRRRATACDRTDLHGIALHFNTFSSEMKMPPGIVAEVGFERARVLILPGAFDRALARCDVGCVNGAVRFQFDHEDAFKVCSTISGALVLVATADSLLFYVRGSTRDGAHAVRCARAFADRREVSLCFTPTRMTGVTEREGNVLVVHESGLSEVSLVEGGAFPRTRVTFL